MKTVNTAVVAVTVLFGVDAPALENGAARTPPMGWNTFNQWGGNWDGALLDLVADSLESTGLKACGYNYINGDGNNDGSTPYWPGKTGFVAWARPIADALHAKGYKFGVYMTTTDNPQKSVQDLVDAQVDLVKHDAFTISYSDPQFPGMRDAIMAASRKIVYSVHSGDRGTPAPDLSNMWRTDGDIFPSWDRVMKEYDDNYSHLASAAPGAWPDPDMLETGCRPYTQNILLSYDESRAHFSMWCMMMAPLLIGFDVTRTHPLNAAPLAEFVQTIAIFANAELTALDQDTIGGVGRRIKGQGALEVWIKNCADGTKAVALFNRTASTANMSISQTELGWSAAPQIYVRDLWLHQDVTPFTGTYTRSVASHAAEIYRMGTSPIDAPTAALRRMDPSVAWLKKNGHDVFPDRLTPGILAGMEPHLKVFDARGRIVAGDPRMIGAGMLVAKPARIDGAAVRLLWQGSAAGR